LKRRLGFINIKKWINEFGRMEILAVKLRINIYHWAEGNAANIRWDEKAVLLKDNAILKLLINELEWWSKDH